MFETEPLRSTPLPVPAPELVDMRGSPEGLPFQPSPIGQWPGERLSVNFDASGWEYFRVWIVVRLLTLLTLGIYSPWAQLRLQRFLAQHTKVGCHAVEIQFQPSKLLFGRVIALMATLIGLGCAMFSPWAGATFIMFAFAAFPWLAVRSAAAKWRRVRLGGHRFGASPRAAPLMWAWWILGLATATSLMLQADFAIQMHFAWVLVSMVSIMAAGWVIGPLATSAVLHATLAQARLGLIPSVLHADVKEVAAVMFRTGLSKSFRWVAVLSFCASVGYTYFKDIRILELTSYAMAIVVGVMGVSYARARRLNFVLNRCNYSAPNEAQSVCAMK